MVAIGLWSWRRPSLSCWTIVVRKAKQLAFRPLRGPLLNSPYSDGEKDAVIDGFANRLRCEKSAKAAAVPSPCHYTGRRCRQADEGQRDASGRHTQSRQACGHFKSLRRSTSAPDSLSRANDPTLISPDRS